MLHKVVFLKSMFSNDALWYPQHAMGSYRGYSYGHRLDSDFRGRCNRRREVSPSRRAHLRDAHGENDFQPERAYETLKSASRKSIFESHRRDSYRNTSPTFVSGRRRADKKDIPLSDWDFKLSIPKLRSTFGRYRQDNYNRASQQRAYSQDDYGKTTGREDCNWEDICRNGLEPGSRRPTRGPYHQNAYDDLRPRSVHSPGLDRENDSQHDKHHEQPILESIGRTAHPLRDSSTRGNYQEEMFNVDGSFEYPSTPRQRQRSSWEMRDCGRASPEHHEHLRDRGRRPTSIRNSYRHVRAYPDSDIEHPSKSRGPEECLRERKDRKRAVPDYHDHRANRGRQPSLSHGILGNRRKFSQDPVYSNERYFERRHYDPWVLFRQQAQNKKFMDPRLSGLRQGSPGFPLPIDPLTQTAADPSLPIHGQCGYGCRPEHRASGLHRPGASPHSLYGSSGKNLLDPASFSKGKEYLSLLF